MQPRIRPLAPHHIVLILLERYVVDVEVAEGVVGERDARVDPRLEQRHALRHDLRAGVGFPSLTNAMAGALCAFSTRASSRSSAGPRRCLRRRSTSGRSSNVIAMVLVPPTTEDVRAPSQRRSAVRRDPDRHLAHAAVVPGEVRHERQRARRAPALDDLDAAEQRGLELVGPRRLGQRRAQHLAAVVDALVRVDDRSALHQTLPTLSTIRRRRHAAHRHRQVHPDDVAAFPGPRDVAKPRSTLAVRPAVDGELDRGKATPAKA